MTIIETATATAPAGTAVTVEGTVRSTLTLLRRIPDRRARVSFRLETAEGPYNVHATGPRAELLRLTVHRGDHVIVHAPCATLSHPAQTIPDLEADSVELTIR